LKLNEDENINNKNSLNLAALMNNKLLNPRNSALNEDSNLNSNNNAKIVESSEAQLKGSEGNIANIEFLMELSN